MIKYQSMELLNIYLKSQVHKVLFSDINSNMLSHCYLISSNDELLLNEYAFFMAKEIYCLNNSKPCNECNNCLKISHSNMVDLCVYPRDDKNLNVDEINAIVSDCYIRPIENDYKVYILKNFDLCTVQAQNKILKTLEEPPANVVFILTCSNPNMILPTITSRAKKISESPCDKEVVCNYLKYNNIQNAEIVASISGGNLGLAMKIASSNSAEDIVNLVFDVLEGLKSSADILKYSSQIIALKKEIKFFLDVLIMVLRDVSVVGSSIMLNFEQKSNVIQRLSKIYTSAMVERIVKSVSLIYNKMEFNCNIVGAIDKLLLDILEVKFLCQK